jgi:hypothetical protein
MVGQEFINATFSLASALLTGKCVDQETLLKRLEICGECEFVSKDGKMMKCGICGCRVSESGLINLARYVETERYGCKFIDGEGNRKSKWKDAGL